MQITLTTTGRITGGPRTVTLYAWDEQGALVVVGSDGGSTDDPAWVGNLRADPHAVLKRGTREMAVEARELEGVERDRAWETVVGRFPLYGTYQRRTARRIPLFLLVTPDHA